MLTFVPNKQFGQLLNISPHSLTMLNTINTDFSFIEIWFTLWLNEKHIEEKLGHKYLILITNKYDSIHRKNRYELVDEPKKQPNRKFLHDKLAKTEIMDFRTTESLKFKRIRI